MHNEYIVYLGYLGAAFTILAINSKTIMPLRLFSMTSNIFAILYAFCSTPILYPVLILNATIFPLNLLRLYQVRKVIKEMKQMTNKTFSYEFLIPYMSSESFKKGSYLFKKGDKANKMYIVQTGSIHLPEIDRYAKSGDIVGEMGILGTNNKRMASALCDEDTKVYSITDDKVIMLCYQSPQFGFYLTRLVTNRLTSLIQ